MEKEGSDEYKVETKGGGTRESDEPRKMKSREKGWKKLDEIEDTQGIGRDTEWR